MGKVPDVTSAIAFRRLQYLLKEVPSAILFKAKSEKFFNFILVFYNAVGQKR